MISRLFKPLDYLRIKHRQKTIYDYVIPLIISIVGTTCIYLLPLPISIFGKSGFINAITGILQILTGFYIASLAAVATFDKRGLDVPLAGKPVILKVHRRGKLIDEHVTRRKFLCLLFGYLALLSFFLYFLGSMANLLAANFSYLTPPPLRCFVKWLFVGIYIFLTANLITTTLHGFYYLVDRIHRQDPQVKDFLESDEETGA